MTNWVLKLGVFSRLLRLDRVVEAVMTSQRVVRGNLDDRLESVTRATMNGETEWFLSLIKEDPDCVLKIIKECDDKDDS